MGVEDLRKRAADLRDRLPVAAGAAARVCATLRIGGRPETGDVDLILRALTDFDGARIRLAQIKPEGPLPETFETLSRALDDAAAETSRSERLRSLVGIQGPVVLESVLEQVRQAAWTGEPQELELLAELIDLAADPNDFQALDEAAELARERLPDGWRPLINAALNRRLEIGEPDLRQVESGGVGAEAASVASDDGSTETESFGPRANPGSVDVEAHESTERAMLGAPPAFGSGSVEASEIVLVFAEPIRPPPPPGHTRPGTSHSLARTAESGVVGPGSAKSGGSVDAATAGAGSVESGSLGAGTFGAGTVGGGPVGAGPVGARTVGGGPVGGGTVGGGPGGGEPGIAEAEVAALRSARFGLAAWLHAAAGRPVAQAQAQAQARRCAGLARDMSEFAGLLSAEFSATAEGLDARSLVDDPAGGLLVWAAAIRAGIVHPTAESIRLLDDLASVVAPYPGLSAYGNAFAHAADVGAYLVPGGSGDARGSQAGLGRQRAVRACARLLAEVPHRRLEPALVEETWRVLVQQNAVLGRLLGTAARDDAAQVDEVADQLAELRVNGALNRMIDETVWRVAGGRAESIITLWLDRMIGDALEVVARWVSAVKGTATVGTDRLAQALAELRGSVERNEMLAAAELSGPAAAAGPVVAAAAGAARLLIRETLELLDGAPVRTAEPPVSHILNRELLLAPAVRIHPATLAPYEPPTLADLIPVALATGEDWEAAFEARAAQGDHEGTRGIIAVLERREPGRVLPLRLRREELVRAARAARDERVQSVRMRVDQGLRDGALNEDAAARIEGTLQELTGPLRDDFGRVLSVLHDLETDLARGTSHNLTLLGGTAGSCGAQS